jgi:hypothetical protein
MVEKLCDALGLAKPNLVLSINGAKSRGNDHIAWSVLLSETSSDPEQDCWLGR